MNDINELIAHREKYKSRKQIIRLVPDNIDYELEPDDVNISHQFIPMKQIFHPYITIDDISKLCRTIKTNYEFEVDKLDEVLSDIDGWINVQLLKAKIEYDIEYFYMASLTLAYCPNCELDDKNGMYSLSIRII